MKDEDQLIFRDAGGCLGGYLREECGSLHCRLYAQREPVMLHVIGYDGEERQYPIEHGELVMAAGEAKKARTAYITRKGEVLLSAGDMTWHVCSHQTETKRECLDDVSQKTETGIIGEWHGKSDTYKDGENLPQNECVPQWPQRRWPPPPLMNCPVYASGRWRDG